jgi:hypothetical protein
MKKDTEVLEMDSKGTGSELPVAHQKQLGNGDLAGPEKGTDRQTAGDKPNEPGVARPPNGKPRKKRKDVRVQPGGTLWGQWLSTTCFSSSPSSYLAPLPVHLTASMTLPSAATTTSPS